MMLKLEKLIGEAKKAAEFIKSYPGDVRILAHYDCDGLCSAAILVKALRREGKGFQLSLVKQLNISVVEEVAKENPKFLVILDMGSGQLGLLKRKFPESKVIVVDHHQIEDGEGGEVVHVNPLVFGMSEDVSGSGITYLLARAMNPVNKDIAGLAVIGAIGDSQMGSIGPGWGLMGLNREILRDAVKAGKIKVSRGLRLWGRYTRPVHKALEYSVDPEIPGVSGSESAAVQFLHDTGIQPRKGDGEWRTLADLSEEEQKKLADGIIKERIRNEHPNPDWVFGDVYELLDKEGDFRDANEFATMLNATGKMDKGHIGIAMCLNDPDSFPKVKEILESYRKVLGDAMRWVREKPDRVRKTPRAAYVLAGSRISEHIISNAISILSKSGGSKPVFGFADAEDGVKVSARAEEELVKKGMNLKDVMARAVKEIGGEGGGHSGAAGATIPKGSEERFISCVENILSTSFDAMRAHKRESTEPARVV